MIWLVAIGLAVWCFVQQRQIADLAEQVKRVGLDGVSQRAPAPEVVGEGAVAPPLVAPPEATSRARTQPPPAPAVFTPVPPASMPTVGLRDEPSEPAAPPPGPASRGAIEWLSEHGLAWLGAGVLALGGLLLVAYAARRGFFSPAVRIWAAVAIGLGALVAGEVLRRRRAVEEDTERLVAALVTGAGAATLYGAIWAAHGLYGFIPAPAAIVLLSAVSLGLLTLSFRHGQALGVLAVVGGFAAPLITGLGLWGGANLTAFVLVILATGAAAAGVRRWSFVAAAALAGTVVWALAKAADSDTVGMAVLAGAAVIALTAATAWVARRPVPPLPSLMGTLPAVAILLASLFALAASFGSGPGQEATGPLLIAVCALAAAAGATLKAAPAWSLAAPGAALVISTFPLAFGWQREAGPRLALLLASAALVALAGLEGGRRRTGAVVCAAIGAAAAALALTLCDGALRAHGPAVRPIVELIAAAGFCAGAWFLRTRSGDPTRDAALAAWVGAAAEAAGLVIHALLPAQEGPIGYALLAVGLAALSLRLHWRGIAETCALAALAAFAALLGPSAGAAVISGTGDWRTVALVGAAAALAQAGAWLLLKRRGQAGGAPEAVSTLAIVTGLLTAFLALRGLGATPGAHGGGLNGFAEASLRTLLMLAAGMTLALRGATTPFGRLRAAAFLFLGAAHGLVLEGMAQHPWWGLGEPVGGAPIVDDLLLGLLAPAATLILAARRAPSPRLRAAYGVAAFCFSLLWLVSETRRLFHGPHLAVGGLGYAESAAYAAVSAGAAAALVWLRSRRAAAPASSKADLAIQGVVWMGAGVTFLLLSVVASPWWGPSQGDLRAPGLLAAGYLAALGFGGLLVVLARRKGWDALARGALIGWLLEAFVAVTLLIRFAYHGATMRAPLREASLETWTFSALWALYGLAVLAFGARRRDATMRWAGLILLLLTTLKVFFFDLARLGGVTRAASFLALGVVLLIAALAARRLKGGEVSRPR